jgi:hypothetical protein
MERVAAAFGSIEHARTAIESLRRAGFDPGQLNVLTPGSTVSEAGQTGPETTLGATVGAALGAIGGFEIGALGAAAVSAVVPGVGSVVAIGIAAAAILGVGGGIEGARLASSAGAPAYTDALRQGRSVVIVMANGKAEAGRARELLVEASPEQMEPLAS